MTACDNCGNEGTHKICLCDSCFNDLMTEVAEQDDRHDPLPGKESNTGQDWEDA